jgi:hypothetical protein
MLNPPNLVHLQAVEQAAERMLQWRRDYLRGETAKREDAGRRKPQDAPDWPIVVLHERGEINQATEARLMAEALVLSYELEGPKPAKTQRAWNNPWEEEEMLEILRSRCEAMGGVPSREMWDRERPPTVPSSKTYDKRFGTWNHALRAAGLPERGCGSRGLVPLEEVA